MSDFWADAEIIDAYSRAQAIDDGFLVDVTEQARETGFRVPVAMTRAAWEDCVAWNDEHPAFQDERGRLHDVLWMAFVAIRRTSTVGDRLAYRLLRIPNTPEGRQAVEVELVLHSGPGDQGEHVITIMRPEED